MEGTKMKKIYINPALQVVKIASQMHILAGSDQNMGKKGNYGDGSGITIGAREFSFDED